MVKQVKYTTAMGTEVSVKNASNLMAIKGLVLSLSDLEFATVGGLIDDVKKLRDEWPEDSPARG